MDSIAIREPFEIITDEVSGFSKKKITVIAGHYCLADNLTDLSNEGESEVLSFELGVLTYLELKRNGNEVSFVLWINDIGISTETREIIKANFKLPDNYGSILTQNGLDISDVEVLFESTARNKASVLFRKIYKRDPQKYQIYDSADASLVRCIDSASCEIGDAKKAYSILGPDQRPLVMKEGTNPKCNLILGTLFYSVSNKYNSDIIINIFNDIYVERIRLGVFVAREVYGLKSDFINFFCDEADIFKQ